MSTSNELRLLFSANGDTITYRLATSWHRDATEPQPFVPFLGNDDYEDLRWYLEDYMDLPTGGALVRAQRIERSLGEWGKRLFDALFEHGAHRDLYRKLLRREAPRLLTVGTKNLDILRLPWELMAEGDRGPLTRLGVTIRRQLESAGPSHDDQTGKLPLRILLAVSRPDDTVFLDPRHTTRAMLDALDKLRNGVVVDFCRPAALDTMKRMLSAARRAGRPYHIVHFNGHGTFLPALQTGVLFFETDGAHSENVRAHHFGSVLAKHRVPLVILEACRSGQVGSLQRFRGVAQAVVEAGVSNVLAMSHTVHMEATKVLLERFYQELAGGATIGQALDQGRAALAENPARWLRRGPGAPAVALMDWFLPHLYQLGPDTALVPERTPPPATETEAPRHPPAQKNEPGAFPGTPMYGFVGRARELHQIERRFLEHRAVLLHAMGGMGKTSLAREAAFWWSRTGLFPDGACFVSFEQAGGAVRAVQVLGAYFEGTDFEKRTAKEQYKRARELFQTKRVLVVWDNFEGVLPAFQEGETLALYSDEERAEIREMFKAWTGNDKGLGRLLITCRPVRTGLGSVCTVELRGLAQPDALSLLHEVMQMAGATKTYEREALVDLLEAIEMHPLSIELVGPHLKDMGPDEIVRDFQKLLDEFKGEAEVERNRSLKASLEFSLMRLSKGAREAVKWLGLFRSGVFEGNLLNVSQMDPKVWEDARRDLEATALVRVDWDSMFVGKPCLRFHPTLAVAADDGAAEAGVRDRYVEVYRAVRAGIDKALRGSNPQEGMAVMVREEANFRRAVGWALEQGAHDRASAMGDTLAKYLQMAGRLQERDRWAAWLADEVRKGGFSAAVAEREMDEAWALLHQGSSEKGIEKLEALVTRLRATTEFDAAFALASACVMLGRVYDEVGWAQKAVAVLRDAVAQWETLVNDPQAPGESTDVRRGNLAATLGDLANALRDAGALDEALMVAERGIIISRERGDHRSIAVGLDGKAQIHAMRGHDVDADAQYDEALLAAQRAEDREMEGSVLQHQGRLASDRGQLDRAAKLYRCALQLFQVMHDEGSVMQTCNLLGVVAQKAGQLDEARGWYVRSREIAVRRGNQLSIGAAAQNLGIICLLEGDAARKQGDEAKGRERFTEAARFFGESLDVWRESHNEPYQAASHSQLAQIHLFLGDLDKAEAHGHHARDIYERLGLNEAHFAYQLLAAIAQVRNNLTEAAAWEQKRDALLAELRRRAGAPALPQHAVLVVTELAVACANAGYGHEPLSAFQEEKLAALATWPAPLDAILPFLRVLSEGSMPEVPPSLPSELADVLEEVLAAVREGQAE